MRADFTGALTSWLVRQGAIDPSDYAIYEFSIYSIVWGLLPIFISFIWGVIFQKIAESLLLILPFIVIRKFSGGFHFSSPRVCFVFSTVLLGGSVLSIDFFQAESRNTLLISLVILSLMELCCFSPVSSGARELTIAEKKLFKKTTQIIGISLALVFFVLMKFGGQKYGVPIGVGITLPALLQIPAVIMVLLRGSDQK